MGIVFVVNPEAGGRSARRKRRELTDALAASGLNYEIRFTEHPRHAVHIARAAAHGGNIVVAIGGDGTVHEVASGLIESGTNVPMGVLPMGSGNDFAKMFDIPGDVQSSLQYFANGLSTQIDYGSISWDGPSGPGTGYFINIGGTGFDAKVAAGASAFKFLTGTPRYVASVLRTLRGWRAPEAAVRFYRGGEIAYSYSGLLFLVLAGNGICSGGGFYLTPAASITDGMLDVCMIRNLSIPRVLSLLPAALKGNHVRAKEVTIEKSDRVTITSSIPLPVQADGEILTERATEIEIRVVPAGLRVLLPVRM